MNGMSNSPFLALRGIARLLAVASLVFLAGPGPSWAQPGAAESYFEICKRLGNIPGTAPMRRCIEEQRAIDIDPLSALSQPSPSDPELRGMPILEEGLPGRLPGASSAEELLKSTPERLLLGPDFRSEGQGVYE